MVYTLNPYKTVVSHLKKMFKILCKDENNPIQIDVTGCKNLLTSKIVAPFCRPSCWRSVTAIQ